jgi:hypothetical protein
MKFVAVVMGLMFFALGGMRAAEQPRVLTTVNPLPVALDRDFQFRKTKLYLLADPAAHATANKANKLPGGVPNSPGATIQDASITFERQYHLYGVVTSLDLRQRYGNYFTFFWRAKRDANITVRLEYRQEKLHAHVQAQEISYPNARGSHKTDLKVVGDDYLEDGQVIAWRCLLIENGRIVAENRSFVWE